MKLFVPALVLLAFCVGCSVSPPTATDVKLHALFGNDMVVQRGMPIAVYGTAKGPGTVNVQMGILDIQDIPADPQGRQGVLAEVWQVQRQAKVDVTGHWRVELPKRSAGGPYSLRVAGADSSTTLHNVMVGEVWVCSGQSNMQMQLKDVKDAPQVLAAADQPEIRLYVQPDTSSTTPMENARGAWAVCTPASAAEFSAVGYYFGRKLHQELGVPIGLIDSSWGGTCAEAWTTSASLEANPELASLPKMYDLVKNHFDEAWRQYEVTLKKWQKEHPEWRDSFQHDEGNQGVGWGWAKPDFADADWRDLDLPRMLTGIVTVNGAFWFRRQIDIPAAWAGKDLQMSLGPIDDFDITYFNGQQVGATGSDGDQTYNLPRKYTVPGALVKAGKATLAVRVFDHYGSSGFGGSPNDMTLSPDGNQKLPLAGTWKFKIEKALDPAKLKPWPAGMPSPPSLGQMPGGLYNGMICPLLGFPFRGAIWYQGESNSDRPQQYRALLPTMIGDWRRGAGRVHANPHGQTARMGEFPFLIVQLPSFGSDWSETREAQAWVVQHVPHTGLAVTLDIPDYDLHPKMKEPVGDRLALQALAKAYGQKIVASGPVYKSMKIEGQRIRLRFDLDGGQLVKPPDNAPLYNFVVAGANRKFYPAKAAIDGDTVLVWSDQVPHPVAARYAWSNIVPACDFYSASAFNSTPLPAGTFRTDDWPIGPAEKK